MSSTQGLNQKVVLFAGRPTDSRKGLCSLLESISILRSYSGLPPFSVWIVGGSPRECELIKRLVDSQPGLRELQLQGRIWIWGRLENEALAELYSRATVTIVPSYREEFGIVAVEAMMCACPVIAARTGGLQDIVEHNATGFLLDPDDTVSLATAISSYLRNDELARIHGERARQRALELFDRNRVYSKIIEVYRPDPPLPSLLEELERPPRRVEARVAPENYARIREIYGQDLKCATVPPHGKHPVIFFESGGERFVAKFFHARASLQASVFPLAGGFEAQRGGLVAYSRTVYNEGNPAAPEIVYYESVPNPLVITKWYSSFGQKDWVLTDELLLETTQRCRGHKPIPPEMGDLLMQHLENVSAKGDACSIREFDAVAAEINSVLTGGARVLCRIHPQVELWRLRLLLSDTNWPLPEEFRLRAQTITNALLHGQDLLREIPKLANADPKPDHILYTDAGALILADFEHSRYAVGPLDMAAWLCVSGLRMAENPNAQLILKRIEDLYDDQESRYACMSWVVAETLFTALLGLSQGDRQTLNAAHSLFTGLSLDLFSREFIR